MFIHEYQSKNLLQQYQIPIPRSHIFHQSDDIDSFAEQWGDQTWIVKSQIHSGGRGKAGGILSAHDAAELAKHMSQLLGSQLITAQTGAEGLPVNALLIEKPANIANEIYLGILIDRNQKNITVLSSSEGGINLEEIAEQDPSKINRAAISKATGLLASHHQTLLKGLQLNQIQAHEFKQIVSNLYRMFCDIDATLVEINPLIVTEAGELQALDAKINIDDNALFRQAQVSSLRDDSQENAIERKARTHGISYVKLNGNIGCIVNGAGLAMATMDLIKHFGGEPANFLDVGGNTNEARVTHAFELLLADDVHAIFVNIFGGIVRCDVIAHGILAALKQTALKVPVVVLLQGTNAEQAKALLKDQHPLLFPVKDLSEGAQLVISKA
ncbi:MAG: ADP-forming succinate--CoA ligase subunit beta [Gammaproteobacteria bacterium]|nr:ADP-forming succinate--CoA ligase subunit beta [Gammaproteobacteria bacterium]